MMRKDREPFTYIPLKAGDIRLLHVSIVAGEAVWCLKTTSLQTNETQVAFDALSYTWGDLTDTFPIICNNQELRVHRNLRDALPYLARRQSSLPIWIDAICINQTDSDEKLTQVRMMHNIYSRANEVWVWLGTGREDSKEAIALLPRIAEVGKEVNGDSMQKSPRPTLESKGLPGLSSPMWQTVYSLIYNPWFFRLWIVQEASLAKRVRVLYGSNEVDWKELEEAVDLGTELGYHIRDVNGQKPRTGDINNHNVFLIRQVVQDPEFKVPWQHHLLRTLLLTLKSHQCSGPYDRVLGILGFITADQIEQIRLDDNPSLPDLYTRFTRFLLSSVGPRKSNWWALLNLAPTSEKLPGLPSWCPDFHALSNSDGPRMYSLAKPISSTKYKGPIPYYASRGISIASQGSDLSELTVRGKIFDTVDRVYTEFPHSLKLHVGGLSAGESSQILLDIRAWERGLAKAILEDPQPAQDSTGLLQNNNDNDKNLVKISIDDYWRTLVGNLTERTDYTLTRETFFEFRRGLDAWAKYVEKLDFDNKMLINECAFGTTDDPNEEQELEEAQKYINQDTPCMTFLFDVLHRLHRRRLFTTYQGRIGFGLETVQAADVVCVLNYSCTAHILRLEKDAHVCTYRLIGEAYVHGMMTGEVEALDLEEQDIILV
ncbi:MAG: hypothetical protein M1820_009450 [Bogoriella megaspora]|nr:MAG: hypothetical protein M1820_009450 [Bogoriella megaspora]